MEQRIILSDRFESDLALCISECEHDGIFVICDTSSHRFCWSEMAHFPTLRQAEVITIVDGDANKNLRQLTRVWERLQKGGANRHSLVINLGGGMVTDLGGFAAATFKRGLSFINVPTTLLAMVDASVGGKTGINFGGMKNEIGTFQDASRVIINTDWLKTLDTDDLRSGYAEMLKHGLLDGEAVYNKLLDYDFDNVAGNGLLRLVEESVNVKRRIVEQDPFEQGLRRALNLGHTAGHAFESLALKRNSPVPHGYAVAWGMVVEAVLSHTEKGFPSAELYRLADTMVHSTSRATTIQSSSNLCATTRKASTANSTSRFSTM